MDNLCFICYESINKGSLYKPCNCNTLIHKDCLEKLVDVNSHKEKCPICLKKYDIVIVSKKYNYSFEIGEVIIFCILYLSSFLIIILSFVLIFEFQSNHEIIIPISLFGLLLPFGLIISIHILHYKKTTKICCIDRRVKLIRRLNLPQPFLSNNILLNV